MRRAVLLLVVLLGALGMSAPALAGPSGSSECHVYDDDCDGRIDEDPANGIDDDGDGAVDEDPQGDTSAHPRKNQVDCDEGSSTDVGGLFFLYAGSNGAEACADDDSSLPIDGRVIATTEQGGYVAADGDNSNPEPANGYVRIDGGLVHCGDDANQDSTAADQSGNTVEDCG